MIIYILLSILMGVTLSIYLPLNSAVARNLGSAITANVTFFSMALLTATAIYFTLGPKGGLKQIGQVPPYLYVTGIISAGMVLGTTYLIPILGARRFFVLVVCGQILTAMLLSHFGWLESPLDKLNTQKVVGAALLITGAIVSNWG